VEENNNISERYTIENVHSNKVDTIVLAPPVKDWERLETFG